MKTLKDLTPEILAKIPEYKRMVTEKLYSGEEYKTNKIEDTERYIEIIYKISGFEKPKVILAKNPEEYKKIFKELHNDKNATPDSHYVTLCSIYSRVYLTWYKFIKDEFNISFSKSDLLDELYELVNKTFISRCYFTDEWCLVLKTPKRIIRNEESLHSVTEAAIQYDGYNMYYVNGRRVEDELITGTFTKEDLINEQNEDVKAAMITIIKERDGQEGLLKFLGAEVVDEQVVKHREDTEDIKITFKNDKDREIYRESSMTKDEACKIFDVDVEKITIKGYSETVRLYKTKERYEILQDRFGVSNQPYCWTEIVCPSTDSTYLIDNSADFTDAKEALMFLRPSFVPDNMDYTWAKFSN